MNNDLSLRIVFFLGFFALIALWEYAAPRRLLTLSKSMRWFSNLGIIFINILVLRFALPFVAMDVALIVSERGWGLFTIYALPYWSSVLIGIITLDLTMYLQHVMFHAVPVLWRLHMVHHADLDFDVTTGLRFHPVEIMLSMGIKIAIVFVLGLPVLAVLVFEILLNATSMFNHGNIFIPAPVDRWLRLFMVTPDMHRVHHSVTIRETNSNFGFNLPWWDRLLGTYRAQPAAGHQEMTIGLSQFRNARRLTLPWMLMLPITGVMGDYPIGRAGREPAHTEK